MTNLYRFEWQQWLAGWTANTTQAFVTEAQRHKEGGGEGNKWSFQIFINVKRLMCRPRKDSLIQASNLEPPGPATIQLVDCCPTGEHGSTLGSPTHLLISPATEVDFPLTYFLAAIGTNRSQPCKPTEKDKARTRWRSDSIYVSTSSFRGISSAIISF